MKKTEINELKPFAFKNSSPFKTIFDQTDLQDMTKEDYAEQQYEKGLALGSESGLVTIHENSTYTTEKGTSSEILGHARNTSELLQGFIDSKAGIKVFREGRDLPVVIQENNQKEDNTPQDELIREVKKEYDGYKIIKLSPFDNQRSLTLQIEQATNYSKSNFEYDQKLMVDVSKVDKVVFVPSLESINEYKLYKSIKHSVEGVEEGANIIRKTDIRDINYRTRENPEHTDFNSSKYTVCIQPKQHHQDQQKVFIMETDTFNNQMEKLKKQIEKPKI
jgi:hypothetical protein